MEFNERIQAILFVGFQFVVDSYIDSYTRIKQVDCDTNTLTLLLRDGSSYNVVPAFGQTTTTLQSHDDVYPWKITLPIDVIANASWFKSLDLESRKKIEVSAPSRAILSMQLLDGTLEEVILPYTLNCQKLVKALQSLPQVITDQDYEEITPTLAAGWQLVTLANPQRCGLHDTLLLLPQKHPIAVEAYNRLYGAAVMAEKIN